MLVEERRTSFAEALLHPCAAIFGTLPRVPNAAVPLLAKLRTIPDSACPNPVYQVAHLNDRGKDRWRVAASVPRMGTSDDKTTRFVVIDPSLMNLEENIYNNDFDAMTTAQNA
jgi:hypothetical protein